LGLVLCLAPKLQLGSDYPQALLAGEHQAELEGYALPSWSLGTSRTRDGVCTPLQRFDANIKCFGRGNMPHPALRKQLISNDHKTDLLEPREKPQTH